MFDKKRYRSEHKEAIKVYNQQWRLDNPRYSKQHHSDNLKKERAYNKQWRIDNPEYHKIYNQKYKEKRNKNRRNKYKVDLKYNLNYRIETEIYLSLKENDNGRRLEKLVDYNKYDLIKHLKKTMPEGYIWQDYLEGKLHIDHIIPISVFDFTKPEHIDFKRCWALENLRLLSAKDNLIKRNKLLKPFQPTLKI